MASPVVDQLASPTSSCASPSRTHFHSHARSMSIASNATSTSATITNIPAHRLHRLSTAFPVHTSSQILASPTRLSRSPTRDSTAPALTIRPEALAEPTGPTDTTFLTAIATQERRVLELKEALESAEVELGRLKRQWALHEANKKKNDARRMTKLVAVRDSSASQSHARKVSEEITDAGGVGSEEAEAAMLVELERRRVIMSGGGGCGRSSTRTLFSGSRHTRTLSLLTPVPRDKPPTGPAPLRHQPSLPPPPPPKRKDSLASPKHPPSAIRPPLLTRASTTPDLTSQIAATVTGTLASNDLSAQGLGDHDLLIRTGRKIATDFKDGLWTFLEDLRQATVGEDHVPAQGQSFTSGGGGGGGVGGGSGGLKGRTSVQTLRGVRSKASLRPTSSRGSATITSTPKQPTRPRQQTAGTSGSPTRRTQQPPTTQQPPDLADPALFWLDSVPAASTPATVKKSPSTARHQKTLSLVSKSTPTASADDAWDAWPDSPLPASSRSDSSARSTAPSTVSESDVPLPASPGTDGRATEREKEKEREGKKKKAPLPWPVLAKMGPATLRRTASHLMGEWERSLTPSPSPEGEEGAGEGVAVDAGIGGEGDAGGFGGSRS